MRQAAALTKRESISDALTRSFVTTLTTRTKNISDVQLISNDVNMINQKLKQARDAWAYSFFVDQAKGLDSLVMKGTKLQDRSNTPLGVRKVAVESTATQVNYNEIKDSGNQERLVANHHTTTQSFDFTNTDLAGLECNEFALLQEASIDFRHLPTAYFKND